ncbi:MAG: VIT1/CCC1 transporter family protein [bacterium]|nr:VIT1/CCC1 transporter family protein [bacterium]MDZ4299687.1 VIT1/CCC1 transporter family protein [Candidatus Sungbacteria bacterium]
MEIKAVGKQYALGTTLIRDELFDLTLYRRLEALADGALRRLLGDLVRIEERHLAFWKDFFSLPVVPLGFFSCMKLELMVFVCRIFGERAVHLILEAIEVNGIRKYLTVWDTYRDTPLGAATERIVREEIEHEEIIVSSLVEKNISPERVQNIFLGFNDGLVEMLGAVSGFFAALGTVPAVLLAAFTVAVAGAFSMGAGVFMAVSSGDEVRAMEAGKQRLTGRGAGRIFLPPRNPVVSGFFVGASYLIGAMVPVFPVLFGAKHIAYSILASVIMIILISAVLAFLSGMNIRRRIIMNVGIIAAAVVVAYTIGIGLKYVFNIALPPAYI